MNFKVANYTNVSARRLEIGRESLGNRCCKGPTFFSVQWCQNWHQKNKGCQTVHESRLLDPEDGGTIIPRNVTSFFSR
jgi:hypothetical protein